MGFLRRYWSEIRNAWQPQSQAASRGRKQLPPVEALEVRMLLVGEFTNLGAVGLTDVHIGAQAWGDYDNDGDLDILLTGRDNSLTPIANVYRNNGNSTFSDLNAGLTGVSGGEVAWGDYDRDGDLDILLTGRGDYSAENNWASITKLYRNNGNSTFTNINAGLTDVGQGSSAAWGDYDNDGDLDILLTGPDSTNTLISRIYRNNGSTFTDINAGLTGVEDGAVAWGDYDNDSDLDILVTGQSLSGPNTARTTKVYRNNGNNTFTDINAGLGGVSSSSGAWGDYDNDGDLDILLTGQFDLGINYIDYVYSNNGNGTFTGIGIGLTDSEPLSVAWGDYDNDGDLDILVTGLDSSGAFSRVFRNNGNTTFTDINAGLVGVISSPGAWGDYDNDGDLDVLLAGFDNSIPGPEGRITRLYRNNTGTANTPPASPVNLTATIASDTSLTFSWSASSDTQTPANGLSYNLRVGTTPGGSDVFSTMSDDDGNAGNGVNGTRRLPSRGPIQGTSFTLKGLTFGKKYYWSVQAVDTAFSGSAFAPEQLAPVNNSSTIEFFIPPNRVVNDNATINPFAGLKLTDPDNQNMLAKVTILNGVVRGDLTPASTTGWTRTVSGNNIVYSRYYDPQADIGGVVQAAVRALVFQPRRNAIKPNTNELTDITLFINDGLSNASTSTRLVTHSVNDAPAIAGANSNVAVNDDATVNPFATLTVSDPDMQDMLISVTILNGVNRGDFTNANAGTGWTVRQVLGNNITYKRYLSPQANVGAAAQAAFRALTFQPRQNAIKPTTTELTDFQVTVSDGVADAVANTGTRVTTTSVNNAPTISGAAANQTMNDNQTKPVFSTLAVTDPDTQDQFVRITINSGTTRGDFTAGSTAGWTRKLSGANILYERFFAAAANNAAVVQTAIRALVFQPRTNITVGTAETTSFTVFVNDGIANVTNSSTSVITTGVAPRPAAEVPVLSEGDVVTVVVPTARRPAANPLARLLRKSR